MCLPTESSGGSKGGARGARRPPPYLKVWIRHYQRHFEFREDEQIKHLQIQLAWFLVLVLSFGAGQE